MIKTFTAILFLSALVNFSLSQQSHNMQLLSHIPHTEYSSACWGYEAGGREYAIYGWLNGTSIIDITNEDDIHEAAFINGSRNGWREMKTYKNYLYIVSEAENSGIQIIDMRYLHDSVRLVNTYFFRGYGRAHTISQSGHYLYISGGNYGAGGIVILDIGENPEQPVKVGEWEDDYVHDCRVVNDTIWACNPLTGRVTVIDAVDKYNPRTISSWINGLYPVPHNCALTADNKYLFVCDENFNNPGKIKIWDVSNKNDIIFVSQWSVPGTNHSVHNVEIFGSYAFISYYGEGVRVLDITNPLSPQEIAWYKTTACWAVYYFNSGKIIASDIYDGLYVFKTQDPISIRNNENISDKFSLSQNYPNPFNPATNIQFQIPKAGFVKLAIFDVLGKEIQTLVNQQLSAGRYEVDFDGTSLPSSVYYYKLETGEYSETKKMVLIK